MKIVKRDIFFLQLSIDPILNVQLETACLFQPLLTLFLSFMAHFVNLQIFHSNRWAQQHQQPVASTDSRESMWMLCKKAEKYDINP